MKHNLFSSCEMAEAFHAGLCIGRGKHRLKPYFDYGVEIKPKPKKNCMLSINLTTEEQVLIKVAPRTPAGRPAKVDGVPLWSVVTGNVTLAVADDGLSCTIVSADEPGPSNVSITADADLGEGVEPISDFIEVIVNGVKATSLGLIADAPTPKP